MPKGVALKASCCNAVPSYMIQNALVLCQMDVDKFSKNFLFSKKASQTCIAHNIFKQSAAANCWAVMFIDLVSLSCHCLPLQFCRMFSAGDVKTESTSLIHYFRLFIRQFWLQKMFCSQCCHSCTLQEMWPQLHCCNFAKGIIIPWNFNCRQEANERFKIHGVLLMRLYTSRYSCCSL